MLVTEKNTALFTRVNATVWQPQLASQWNSSVIIFWQRIIDGQQMTVQQSKQLLCEIITDTMHRAEVHDQYYTC
jgi:hypothetical protein